MNYCLSLNEYFIISLMCARSTQKECLLESLRLGKHTQVNLDVAKSVLTTMVAESSAQQNMSSYLTP